MLKGETSKLRNFMKNSMQKEIWSGSTVRLVDKFNNHWFYQFFMNDRSKLA